MCKKVEKLFKLMLLFLIFITLTSPISAFANDTESSSSLKYYIGSVVNTGKNNGYSESHMLDEDDPHYGWTLGNFFVEGYTSTVTDKDNNPIFLKNVGDKVGLYFNLEQDINKLNGQTQLTISEDKNGYDKIFGVQKQNFGRGTLIIRHTDYQNKTGESVVYTNYLEAKATQGADTKVELFEEGDYEITLDYEIKNNPRKVLGVSIFPSYTNYRISFKFSVRNGNCMVYPFDVATGDELTNTSITESGFRLDLAKSRYLDTNIKKEVLKEGANGLTEDTRYNQPAKDGNEYTEEGIYTITVTNRYTEEQTVKKIYVGTNDLLKAYVTTGLSIQEIEKQIANGARINSNGTILLSTGNVIKENQGLYTEDEVTTNNIQVDTKVDTDGTEMNTITQSGHNSLVPIIVLCAIGTFIIVIVVFQKKKKKRKRIGNKSLIKTPDNCFKDEEE